LRRANSEALYGAKMGVIEPHLTHLYSETAFASLKISKEESLVDTGKSFSLLPKRGHRVVDD
jgi:hypothetical protein